MERKGELASTEFREWFEARVPEWRDLAEKTIKKGEQHMPMFLAYEIEAPNSIAILAAVPKMDSPDDKNMVAYLHRRFAERQGIYAVVFVVEAWTLITDPDKNLKEQRGEGSLAHHPDRQEAMIFNALHGKQQLIAMCRIDRANSAVGKANVSDPMADLTEGRMILNENPRH